MTSSSQSFSLCVPKIRYKKACRGIEQVEKQEEERKRRFFFRKNVPFIKTRIEWPPVTATARFPNVFFQLLQYSRQCLRFSAHRAALMKKTTCTSPAAFFFLRFIDFTVQFCFRSKFSFHEKQLSKFDTGVIFLHQSQFSATHSNQ